MSKNSKVLEAALKYTEMGFHVIPLYAIENGTCNCEDGENCESPGKHPRITWAKYQDKPATSKKVMGWWKYWPKTNVGIITGAGSGIIVLDVDGPIGEKTLKEGNYHSPPTVIAKTGGGGWHYLYKHPGFECRNFASKIGKTILPKVDFRGDGGLIVAPPSLHKSGNQYEWALPPEDSEIAEAPEWLLELIKKQAIHAGDGLSGKKSSMSPEEWEVDIPHGERNNEITRRAGSLLAGGKYPIKEVISMVQAINLNHCKPPLENKEVEGIVLSIANKEKRKPTEMLQKDYSQNINLTDLGNARRLVKLHGNNIRYSHEAKKWYVWDGKRWKQDNTGEIKRLAKDAVKMMYKEAAETRDDDAREELIKHALKSESDNRIKAMIALAESEPGIPITLDQFDRDLHLLNCLNGVLDLRTGEIKKHAPEYLITKMAPVQFDPNAESEIWEQFLERVIPDPEVRYFVQRFAGYSITGDVGEEKMAFLYGPPATGKTTFLRAVTSLLGEYAATADFEAFLAHKNQSGGPRNDIARLSGKRFVISVEVEEGKKLAEGLVNQLTGGDTVSARFLYQESFEFIPQFKLWLAANNRPRVTGTDGAIWRRILQIPFNVQIPENERNPQLKSILCDTEKMGPAILNWLVQGYIAWQQEGLNPPEMVRQTTEEYKQEMDPLADFIQDCCIVMGPALVRNPDLWEAYVSWCKRNGEKYPLGRKKFSQTLIAKGFDQYHDGKDRVWTGIGLTTADVY